MQKKSTWRQSENFSVSTYYTTALLTRWPGEILGVKKIKSTSNIKVKIKSLHGALFTYISKTPSNCGDQILFKCAE